MRTGNATHSDENGDHRTAGETNRGNMKESEISLRRMTLWTILCTAATWVICRFHPYENVREITDVVSSPWIDAWILFQAFSIALVPLLLVRVFHTRNVRWIRCAAAIAMFLIPAITLVNVLSVAWIDQRVFQFKSLEHLFQHGNAVVDHVPQGARKLMIGGGIGLTAFAFFGGFVCCRWGKAWSTRIQRLTPTRLMIGCFVSLGIISGPMLLAWPETLSQMQRDHSRHPFSVFGITNSETPTLEFIDKPASVHRGLADEMKRRINAKDSQLSNLRVASRSNDNPSKPDVLVVVIESFRRELVAAEIMPNLSNYAKTGIHCRNHFSGGNATPHGVFSLFNGIDALWYSFLVRNDPLMMRLFHEAGYEVGFFAGHDDWRKFRMEGFINQRVFDRYHTSPRRWLSSDRQATELAASFLDTESSTGKPRLAVLYLYSTHADYHSYADDQIFQPAAKDGFLIPYTQAMREQVWNRYKNSARSIDRLLAGVLRRDRVIVITGDHGESFLEDGVCGHGTKLNQYQNGTPAVIYTPGSSSREITQPTSHADLLPTVLDAAGLSISNVGVLDGQSLLKPLTQDRVVCTRNYLDNECWLISANHVAQRYEIVTSEWRTMFLGEEKLVVGLDSKSVDPKTVFDSWLDSRLQD